MFRKVAGEKNEVLHEVVNYWMISPSLKYLKLACHGEASYGWSRIGAGPVVSVPDTRTQHQNIEHSQ